MSQASDAAAIVLRGVVGSTMIAHGVKHGRTLKGTAGWFGSIGFRQPDLQAKASAGVEVLSGAALVGGLATPVAAAAVIGTMGVAVRSVHASNGFFVTSEGYEYALNLMAACTAIAALGPGRFSMDEVMNIKWPIGNLAALSAMALGLGAAAAQLSLFWRRPVDS